MPIVNKLRAIFFLIVFIPWTVFWALLMAVLAWHPKHMVIGNYFGSWWSSVNLWILGVKLDLDLAGLDPKKRYVFMANHSSNTDITVLYAILRPYRVLFVAKQSLFTIPIFKWAMKGAGHISIDRSNRRAGMKSVQEAVDKAAQGHSPIIFPEGTRNPNPDKLLPFKIGGIVLALKCDHPVVPLVLWGTQNLLPPGKFLPRAGTTVRVRALPPIDKGKYTVKDREQMRDDLYETMNAARKELARG